MAAFERFDRDKSGGLDTRELGKALQELGIEADSQQTIAMLQRFDDNSSGALDIHQFGELVQASHREGHRGWRGKVPGRCWRGKEAAGNGKYRAAGADCVEMR